MLSLAKPEDVPALENIWTMCFGDEREYQDLFFQHRFCPQNTVVWREQGIAVAMAHLMPYSMPDGWGKEHLCFYLYAVATLPKYQGQGISTHILSFAARTAQDRGARALSLVPASPALFDFYRKRGYHTEYYVKQAQLSRADEYGKTAVIFAPCTPEELFAMRESYYGDTPFFVRWGKQALNYILLESSYVGRECLSFSGKRHGYLFCEQGNEGSLFIREIGCTKEDFPTVVAALFTRYPKTEKLVFRLKADSPLGKGEILPFGMTYYLSDTEDKANLPMTQRLMKNEKTVPYMGLMMD